MKNKVTIKFGFTHHITEESRSVLATFFTDMELEEVDVKIDNILMQVGYLVDSNTSLEEFIVIKEKDFIRVEPKVEKDSLVTLNNYGLQSDYKVSPLAASIGVASMVYNMMAWRFSSMKEQDKAEKYSKLFYKIRDKFSAKNLSEEEAAKVYMFLD